MIKTFIQVASSLFVSAIVSSGQLHLMIVGTALATATSTSAIIVTALLVSVWKRGLY